jgi:hypothetical protein
VYKSEQKTEKKNSKREFTTSNFTEARGERERARGPERRRRESATLKSNKKKREDEGVIQIHETLSKKKSNKIS